MRRFTIQDLQRPNQQYESRVGDDFQPLVVQAPNLPAIPDLMKIADATSKYLDKREAHNEEKLVLAAKKLDAEKGEQAAMIRDRLFAAGDGKEGDEVEKAWLAENRKMIEEGLVPANSSIAYLRTIADLEAQRVKGDLKKALEGEAYRLGRITDENGDRASLEDPLETFDALYAEYLDKPVFDQSPTALRHMLKDREAMRQEFDAQVYGTRTENERERDIESFGQAYLTGVEVDGVPIFGGLVDLGSADLRGADRFAQVEQAGEAIRFYRDERSVPEATELFTSAMFSHVNALIASGSASEAKRVLASAADVEVTPGLRLEADNRYDEAFALAFKDAEDAEAREENRTSEKRSRFNDDVMKQARFYYINTPEGANNEQARRAAKLEFRKSDEYLSMLDAAGYTSEPAWMDGLFTETFDAVDRAGAGADREASKEALAGHQIQLLEGVDRDAVIEAAVDDPRLSKQDLRTLMLDPGAEKWDEWRDHPEASIADQQVDAAMNIPNASPEVEAALTEARVEWLRRQKTLVDSAEDVGTVSSSQEWARGLDQMRKAAAEQAAKVAAAQEAILTARERGDWAAANEAASAAKGILSPGYIANERAQARDRELTQNRYLYNSPAAINAQARVDALVERVNQINQADEGGEAAAILKDRTQGLFVRKLDEKSKALRAMQPEEARRATETLYDDIVAEIREEILPEEQQALEQSLRGEDAERVNVVVNDLDTITALAGSNWSTAGPLGPIRVTAMDNPKDTTPALEFITKPSTTARRVEAEVFKGFREGVGAGGDYFALEKDLVRQALTTGILTPEDALGEGLALRFVKQGEPDETTREALEANGWVVKYGGRITGPDGLASFSSTVYEKTIEAKPSPYTTLYFRGDTRTDGYELLDTWLKDTPPADRESFYRGTGRAFTTLEETDREFERHQRILLNRFTK